MKIFIFLSVFVAFLSGCFWVILTLKEDIKPNEASEVTRLVAVASDVTARYYDENNQLEQVINSDQVREYSGNKGTFFERVFVQGMDDKKLSLKANSQKAWMAKDNKIINFFEGVQLIDDPNGENPIVIKGQKVSYQVKPNQLLSDESVIVNDKGSEQQLSHFIMDLTTRVITSNEKITAIFTPVEQKTNR